MNECKFNYSLADNLSVAKQVFHLKRKARTGIVSVLVLLIGGFGMFTVIDAIAQSRPTWWLGIVSFLLLAGYFLGDFFTMKCELKKQTKFFFQNGFDKISKVVVCLEKDVVTETFFEKENVFGQNKFFVKDLKSVKFDGPNIFLAFAGDKVVMLKTQCLTCKQIEEYTVLGRSLKKSK